MGTIPALCALANQLEVSDTFPGRALGSPLGNPCNGGVSVLPANLEEGVAAALPRHGISSISGAPFSQAVKCNKLLDFKEVLLIQKWQNMSLFQEVIWARLSLLT